MGTDAHTPLIWWIRGAVALVLAIAVVDWLNWSAGIAPLTWINPDWPQMMPWSAALLAGLGVAILLQSGRPSRARVWAGRFLAASAGAVAVVFAAEYARGVPFGLDRILFPGAVSALEQTWPGRPSLQAVVSLLALAGAVVLLRLERRWATTAWPLCIAAASALPLIALVTALFDAAEMLGASPSIGINAATAAGIVLLVNAAVAVRPDRQPVAWLVARPDRRMLVRLVVTLLLVPIWVAIWRLVLLAFGLGGDQVWVLSVTLATLILGVPFFVLSKRVQRLMADQLVQTQERAEIERQRAQAVERYRILAENAVDVVVHLRDGRPVWVSPSIRDAFGWPAELWINSDFVPRIHPDDLEAVFGALAENAAGKAAVARFRVATADGDYRWVEGHGKPYSDAEGTTDGVIVALRSIDMQVEVERELQQALDFAIALAGEKSDYVATVSHEIRSPIHAILGFAELLENQLSSEGRNEAAEWSRRVRMEAERLTRLLDDLLDLARLDAGSTKLAAKTFRLRKMVDEVIQMSRLKAEAKGLRLEYSVDPTISDCRIGDADRLHQVLHNLVTNAKKFTREGRIDVEVSPAGDGTSDDLVRFAVTDTGPGIPAEQIDRILEPFAQVWGSDADAGSGLGLAISDRLVKAMGGNGLEIASLEGHGSTFHFTVPLPETEPQAAEPGREIEPTETGSHRTILVVDDNATNRMLVEAQLTKLGYACESAADGAEAVNRIASGGIDAVLMDCNMPVMDGYEATRRIRAGERGTGAHLPILALTASTVGSNRDACERAGMDGFLGKPLLLSTLAAEIGRLVGAAQADGSGSSAEAGSPGRTTDDAPVLDEARVDRLLDELGAVALRTVVATFVDEMPRRLETLREMAAKLDADAVRRSAHAIRSPSAMLGATALAAELRAIEESADPVSLVSDKRLDKLIDASIEKLRAKLGQPVDLGGAP
ncbi:response regulator [Mycobacterium sp. Y57]|uniref:ATP-binding protein n=1 Tax=Mycolicibacterium xanthum TaxID=2796469 RepID=UPI001C85E975|nr:ATP-binding protein [Mycolicibacterium xanthum]MBX7433098.1 response regulator [Mycolicibacterium xanthum]